MAKILFYLISKLKNEFTLSRIKDIILIRFSNIPHELTWRFPLKESKKNKMYIRRFKNIHNGKKCFIIANGPSIRKMDLKILKNEITIGMNKIHLMEKKIGFLPNYLVVSDIDIMHDQFHEEFSKISGSVKFFNWNSRKYYRNNENIIFFKEKYFPHFSKDLTKSVYSGHSVTNVCIQIAYYMGFKEVILIGKDHNYTVKGTPGKKIEYMGAEKDHFSSKYYKKNQFYRIPDYKGEELAYTLSKKAFDDKKVKIYDATINGKLNVFEKKEFKSFFKGKF